MKEKIKEGFLSGSQLKMIALLAMTVDHIGFYLFPDVTILRIIGRVAFPIFAYMIGEGCAYTKNRKKYFLTIFLVGAGCQLVTFVVCRSLFQNVLITFSLSIGLICIFDDARKKKNRLSLLRLAGCFGLILFLTDFAPRIFSATDYALDYGFGGAILPLAVFAVGEKRDKLIMTAFVLFLIALNYGGIQWFSFGAIPLLAFYNGKRGKHSLKNLFYVYYPLHLALIILIGVWMKVL